MHMMDQRILGALILLLLAALIVVKREATGSVLEKPKGRLLLWLVNIFNLFFLIVANPLAAILLIARRMPGAAPSVFVISSGWLLTVVELAGFAIYLMGFLLMGWALIHLGRNYQLGGSDPRAGDAMVQKGPYALIRHPMYAAALCIALGISCLTQSLVCLGAFLFYLVLILLLIPIEEASLTRVYGAQHVSYRRNTKKLIPGLF